VHECRKRGGPAGRCHGILGSLASVGATATMCGLNSRWARGGPAEARKDAEELVRTSGGHYHGDRPARAGSARVTHSVPIAFNSVIHPVGGGEIDSLARPGGNATGFITFDYALPAKWAELLKQIAPTVTRVAVLRDSAIAAGIGQFAVIQSVAP